MALSASFVFAWSLTRLADAGATTAAKSSNQHGTTVSEIRRIVNRGDVSLGSSFQRTDNGKSNCNI
jgi:hypothetical protein